jgi:nitrile hydratase
MDGAHDMGGMHGFGEAVWPGSDAVFHERWEQRVFAMHMLISIEELGSGPGGRATREQMEPAHYLDASYYERWLWSAERCLERNGTITAGELDVMADRLRAGGQMPETRDSARAASALAALREDGELPQPTSPGYAVDDRVRVRRMRPEGHTRCPRYIRGVAGVVERIQGADRLPDLKVYGIRCEREPVYAIAFRSDDVWGAQDEPAYTILLDLWESYLEPA